ncbi:MAG: hypothetical protein WDO73_17560 [Ignavibacteriota bacterium]
MSDRPVTLSEFRNTPLTAKQKGLQVQARRRYWAQRLSGQAGHTIGISEHPIDGEAEGLQV